MGDSPFGGIRPFVDDDVVVIIAVGIDGPDPPLDVQISLRESISLKVEKVLEDEPGEPLVEFSVNSNPTEGDRQSLGSRTLHVQQYDIDTGLEVVGGDIPKSLEIEIKKELRQLGFNVVGTEMQIM